MPNTIDTKCYPVDARATPQTNKVLFDGSLRPRLGTLTTLRFFAALHVVLFHMRVVGILSGGPWWYQHFASIGYLGVNCFFVLSGFILVYTYSGPVLNVRRFWQARFARIYPAYVLSLIISAPGFFFAVRQLNLPFFAWSKQHLAWACVLTVSLLQAWVPQAALTWNPVCWSLSVEAFFYLAFPLLLRWSQQFSQRKLAFCFIWYSLLSLSLSLSYMFLHPDGIDKISSPETNLFWKNVLSFNPLARLPEFLVGMFAGRLFLTGKTNPKKAALLVLSGLLVVATLTIVAGKIPTPLISAGFLSPAFAAIIYGLALQPKWLSFLKIPLLALLGDASYSLYLLHSFVIMRVFEAMALFPWWARVAGSLAAAIVVSLISYLVVEEPARNLLRPKRKKRCFASAKPVSKPPRVR